MRPQVITVSSATQSAPIPMDTLQVPFNVGFGVTLGGGTMTYTVEHTFDNVLDPAVTSYTWFPNSVVAGVVNLNKDGNYAFPVAAIRLNVTAYTSGTAKLTIIQGQQS